MPEPMPDVPDFIVEGAQRYDSLFRPTSNWQPVPDDQVRRLLNGAGTMLAGALLLKIGSLKKRVTEAEAIIRAQNALQVAMYNSDFEVSWPREAAELESAYCEAYGVTFDGDDPG